MNVFREAGRTHGVAITVCGFGAAFAIHFTEEQELLEYRDTLGDDQAKLGRFLYRMAEMGFHALPDGRSYLSVVHTEDDIAEAAHAIDRIIGESALHEDVKR
jgi:glutamate-1-semialdehyde aminotransferase